MCLLFNWVLSIITWEKKQLGNDVNKEKACTSLHWWFYNKDDSQLATVKALTHTHCSWIMRSFLKLLSWWSWREWLTENLFPLPICTYFFPFRGGDSVRVLYSLIYESDYIEDKKNSILQVWSMQENKSTSCVLGNPKSTGNLQKSVAARENICPKT